MAEDLIRYMREMEATEPPEFVSPEIYYGPQEDSLTVYIRKDESFARRLTNLVTVFLSFDGKQLVGCQVKGLRRKLEHDGTFSVAIKRNGKLELGLFFHLLAYEVPQPEPRNRLVELGQMTKGFEIDPEKLALSEC